MSKCFDTIFLRQTTELPIAGKEVKLFHPHGGHLLFINLGSCDLIIFQDQSPRLKASNDVVPTQKAASSIVTASTPSVVKFFDGLTEVGEVSIQY